MSRYTYMQTYSVLANKSWTTFFFLALIVFVDFLTHFHGIFQQHRYSFNLLNGDLVVVVVVVVEVVVVDVVEEVVVAASVSSWATLIYNKTTIFFKLKNQRQIKKTNVKKISKETNQKMKRK